MTTNCYLCGREVQSPTLETVDERSFCSSGCHDVYTTLGDADSPGVTRTSTENEVDQEEDAAPPDQHRSRTFLRIDGMYSATCEAYLESLAEDREGCSMLRRVTSRRRSELNTTQTLFRRNRCVTC